MGGKAMRVFGLSVALALTLAGGAVASVPERPQLPSWLAGAWAMKDGDRWGDEFWTPPRAGLMIGAARMGRGDKLLAWEHTRIGYDEAGKLAFWAMPRGVPASKFPVVAQTATSVTFASAAHDYPQRVRYWREGKLLKAEIALIDGSKAMRFSYAPMGS